jgi:hypothetical protein
MSGLAMKVTVRLLLTIGLVALLSGGVTPSRASCAPPTLSLERFRAQPQERIVVTGQAWMLGCDDTGGSVGGSAGGCSHSDNEEIPLSRIDLRIKGPRTDQTDHQLSVGVVGQTDFDLALATINANDSGSFETTITIPDLPGGTYFITGASNGHKAYSPPQLIVYRAKG